jgi:protein-disulfide isomerase/uncharacterized membrane protein
MRQMLKLGLPVEALVLAGLAFYFGGQGNNLVAIALGVIAGASLIVAAMAVAPLLGGVVGGVAATGVSLYLTVQHHAATDGASVCNINETFNCDVVNSSVYSEIGGVPIALLGAAFYLAVTVFSWNGWREREGYTGAPALLVVAGAAASAYSVFLAGASATLGAWCLFCMSLYLVNLLLLVSGILARRARPDGPGMMAAVMGTGDSSISVAVTTGALALIAGILIYRGQGDTTSTVAEHVEEGDAEALGLLYAAAGGPIELTGREPVYGDPDAPYTIVEWADYECPYCARVGGELKALVTAIPDLKVVFKNYPLSSNCNPNLPSPMHENACGAAAAGICADEQGLFWQLNEMMFNNQQYLAPDDLLFMAGQVGLDMDAFKACLEDGRAERVVTRDIAAGAKADIHSTPALFLGGVHPDGWISIIEGSEAIPLLLKAKAEGWDFPPAKTADHGH